MFYQPSAQTPYSLASKYWCPCCVSPSVSLCLSLHGGVRNPGQIPELRGRVGGAPTHKPRGPFDITPRIHKVRGRLLSSYAQRSDSPPPRSVRTAVNNEASGPRYQRWVSHASPPFWSGTKGAGSTTVWGGGTTRLRGQATHSKGYFGD